MKKLVSLLGVLLILSMLFAGCSAKVSAEDADLSITGMVEKHYTEDMVKEMETIDIESENKDGEVKTYTGVSITTLLADAGAEGVSTVIFVADDGYEAEVAIADIEAAGGIISFRNNGGFSVVLPDMPGNAQVKGLVELKVK